jgi:protoheme IX farnesyltransferase
MAAFEESASFPSTWFEKFSLSVKKYYSLTKPGVLYGNVISGVAGFLLAAVYFQQFTIGVFAAAIGGMTLVIASACVLNNVLDQDIDCKMERTKTRAVASGDIASVPAAVFSAILGVLGIAVLALWVNWLVVIIGVAGFATYVWLYGATSKRLSIHGTLVGSISGAAPILAGYVAVANRIDIGAILLFAMLFFWQFPEFYSIAIYRKKEYAAAQIPVMTVVKGVKNTKVQILVYSMLFVYCTLLLTIFGYTGWIYFGVMALAGMYFVGLGVKGLRTNNSEVWAHKMFHTSLLVLLLLSAMLPLGALLP